VLAAAAEGGPPGWVGRLMDFCYQRALRPVHASCDDRWTHAARMALYVRSHWIRMPLHLLVVHLGRKALQRPKPPDEAPPAKAARRPQAAGAKLPTQSVPAGGPCARGGVRYFFLPRSAPADAFLHAAA